MDLLRHPGYAIASANVVASLEQIDAVALLTNSDPPFFWSTAPVCRSVIYMSGRVGWLCDIDAAPEDRVQRGIALRLRAIQGMDRIPSAVSESYRREIYDDIVHQAERWDVYTRTTDEGLPTKIGDVNVPPDGGLVKLLLGDSFGQQVHFLLAGYSHGDLGLIGASLQDVEAHGLTKPHPSELILQSGTVTIPTVLAFTEAFRQYAGLMGWWPEWKSSDSYLFERAIELVGQLEPLAEKQIEAFETARSKVAPWAAD